MTGTETLLKPPDLANAITDLHLEALVSGFTKMLCL